MVRSAAEAEHELDVRRLRKPEKHPTIFRTYDALPAGSSLVLVNDHDPRHLREEFEVEHPASHHWEYLRTEPRDWRIRITKLTTTPLPRVLLNCTDPEATEPAGDATGAVWKLPMAQRDLDSNLIALSPDEEIGEHDGPDLDVLVLVVSGGGRLVTEAHTLDLRPGDLVWLPRRSRRKFGAGPEGLRYLTVHQRRRALVLETTPR